MNEEKIDIEYWFLSQYLLSMCQRYNINSNTLKFMWVCYLMEKIERFSLKKKTYPMCEKYKTISQKY